MVEVKAPKVTIEGEVAKDHVVVKEEGSVLVQVEEAPEVEGLVPADLSESLESSDELPSEGAGERNGEASSEASLDGSSGEGSEEEPDEGLEDTSREEAPSQAVPTSRPVSAYEEGSLLSLLNRWFPGHAHAALGGFLGLVVALTLLAIGVWKTLLIVVLVLIGVAFGQHLDDDPQFILRARKRSERDDK